MIWIRRKTFHWFDVQKRCPCRRVQKLCFFCVILLAMMVFSFVLFDCSPEVARMDGITRTEEGSSPKIPCTVEIKMHKAIAVVDERFLSVCMSWRNRERWKFDSKREARLIALTKALSPAYMRIGGNPSNFLVFRSTSGEERTQPYGELTEQIEEEDLDRINEIAENAVWRVLFALSSLRRQINGSWDPSNTYEIIKYVEDRGYTFGWELGNEYNLLENFDASISPEQLVEDYRTLKQYLSSPATLDNFLVGPDVTQPRGIAMEYLERFLEKGHSFINAVTWHHYYVRSIDSSPAQFYVPEVLDTLLRDMETVDGIVGKTAGDLPIWLGETSSASGGGAVELSDRFLAGFMWLDKLGLAAQRGYKVVIRQTMFSGNYALVGPDLEPNPDYWLSVLHKKLFGTKVLMVKREKQASKMVRIYSHCTNTKYGDYKPGAVSIMAMNLHPNKEARLYLIGPLKELSVDEYLLSPEGDTTSRKMKLNDKILEMGTDSTFPALEPRPIKPRGRIILPPLSFAFYVVPGARAHVCMAR